MQNMLMILTSTLFGEVGLFAGDDYLSMKFTEPASHTKMLTANIQNLLEQARISLTDLDIIAVDRGPGSHTGIRIGLITAQMLSFRHRIPVLGINALENLALLASKLIKPRESKSYSHIMPVISCRKGELYTQKFTLDAEPQSEPRVENTEDVQKIVDTDPKIYCCGKAAETVINLANNPMEPNISAMHQLAQKIMLTNPSEEYLRNTLKPLYLHKPLAKPKIQ